MGLHLGFYGQNPVETAVAAYAYIAQSFCLRFLRTGFVLNKYPVEILKAALPACRPWLKNKLLFPEKAACGNHVAAIFQALLHVVQPEFIFYKNRNIGLHNSVPKPRVSFKIQWKVKYPVAWVIFAVFIA